MYFFWLRIESLRMASVKLQSLHFFNDRSLPSGISKEKICLMPILYLDLTYQLWFWWWSALFSNWFLYTPLHLKLKPASIIILKKSQRANNSIIMNWHSAFTSLGAVLANKLAFGISCLIRSWLLFSVWQSSPSPFHSRFARVRIEQNQFYYKTYLAGHANPSPIFTGFALQVQHRPNRPMPSECCALHKNALLTFGVRQAH